MGLTKGVVIIARLCFDETHGLGLRGLIGTLLDPPVAFPDLKIQ